MNNIFDKVIERRSTACLKWDAIHRYFGAGDVLPMWVADMDFMPPEQVVSAVVERARHGVYGYPIRTSGFYQAVAGWVKKRQNWDIASEWIISTPGIVTAINLAVQAYTEPGDKIIIQPPVYPPFAGSVLKNKRKLVENPLVKENGRYTMDFADLEAKAAGAKMLLLCSPHNPVGRVWTREELTRLADICLRHSIVVVSDEIHGDLVYPGHQQLPLARLSTDIAANTVTCIAPSKTFNLAGLFASVIIISNETLRAKFQQAVEAVAVGDGNVFGITALEAAYTYGGSWLEELLAYLAGNAEYVVDYINKNVPAITTYKPESTFLAWLDCQGLGLEPKALREFFNKEAKVGLNPGITFGQQGALSMRLNFGCPRAMLAEGLERIATAVAKR